MTPLDKLVTVNEGFTQDKVMKLMYQNRIEKILVVDESNTLTGLVTMKDIEKAAQHPNATKDLSGRLRVAAALGTESDTLSRAHALFDAGVDIFVIDSAHGHSRNVIKTIQEIKENFKDVEITCLFLETKQPILMPHMLYLLDVESITIAFFSNPSIFSIEVCFSPSYVNSL